jgi:hypothetical protein
MRSLRVGWRVMFALVVVLAAMSRPAAAEGTVFNTETTASAACGADEVVWVDLDRTRFYHKGQAEYAKGSNGGYGCLNQIATKYRPARTQ